MKIMFALWFYYGSTRRAFYLPDTNYWKDTLNIGFVKSEKVSGDVCFQVRCQEKEWSIYAPWGFKWQDEVNDFSGRLIKDHFERNISDSKRKIFVVSKSYEKKETHCSKYVTGDKEITVGSDKDNVVCIDSDIISGRHASLRFNAEGQFVFTDHNSKNGTYVNGKSVRNSSVMLKTGDSVDFPCGVRIIYLGKILAITDKREVTNVRLDRYTNQREDCVETQPETKSLFDYINRPPVYQEQFDHQVITVEHPPVSIDEKRNAPLWLTLGPSLSMILPMMAGSIMMGMSSYRVPGMIMMGTSAVLSAAWGFANRTYNKKNDERTKTEKKADYLYRLSYIETKLAELDKLVREQMYERFPSGAECLSYIREGKKIWERVVVSNDFLKIRLGTGTIDTPYCINIPEVPMGIAEEVDDHSSRLMDYHGTYTEKDVEERQEYLRYMTAPLEIKRKYSLLNNVPVVLDLEKYAILGIAGGKEAEEVIFNIIAQIAALNSYTEVRVAVLSTQKERSTWQSVRWIPHASFGDSQTRHMVASTPEGIQVLLNALDETWGRRQEAVGSAMGDEKKQLPHYVLICTDVEAMTLHPLYMHMASQSLGFSVIIQSNDVSMLPKECRAVLDCNAQILYDYINQRSLQCKLDNESESLMKENLRKVARLREKGIEINKAIPEIATLFEPYGFHSLERFNVMENWNRNDTGAGIEAILGLGAGSKPFILNISDKYHGPHGIIAGTTGSGKSELLRTYVLSLAMRYKPSDVQFILIDYKGGGAFNDFRELPHVVGLIDNLQSEKAVMRALWSIQGEIHRRELLFKSAGVSSIDEYNAGSTGKSAEETLAHLVIVIDEFAQLKDIIPSFMHELIETARVGRSVGLHLILATQKPAGSVNDEIWSNSRFHICLRVQTKADSNDMLHRSDAAYIKGAGRCYVQVGNDELFEQVQTCWSGAEYTPDKLSVDEMPRLLDDSGRIINLRKQAKKNQTQMEALLNHLIDLGNRYPGFKQGMLWKEELKSVISFDEAELFAGNYPRKLNCPFAMLDDARNQQYLTASIDLIALRSVIILGPATSGKTTCLQTMIYSLSRCYTVDQVQLYVLSLDSHTLASVSEIPHVRDVLFAEDKDECIRLLIMLEKLIKERKERLNAAGTDSFAAYNLSLGEGEEHIPAVVVMIDRLKHLFDGLNEEMQERCADLIRTSAGCGVFFIGTALERNEIHYRLRETFAYIGLNLRNTSEYYDCGIRVPAELISENPIAGRGVYGYEGNAYEMQVLLPFGEANDSIRRDKLAAYAKTLKPALYPLPRVPRIPEGLYWKVFEDVRWEKAYPEMRFPIVYSKNTGLPIFLNMEKQYSSLVVGGRKTGKTTFLRAVCQQVLSKGGKAFVVGKKEEWSDLINRENMHFADIAADSIKNVMREITDEIEQRSPLKKQWLGNQEALRKLSASFEPVCLLMDNIDSWYDETDKATGTPYLSQLQKSMVLPVFKNGIYYNLLIIGSVNITAYNRLAASNEVIDTLLENGAGFALRDTILDCNPWNVTVKRGSMTKRSIGEGYMICGDTLETIVFPNA